MNQELANFLARCVLVFTAGYELAQLGRSPFEIVAVTAAIVLL
jgi:hypothetical protein